MSRQSKHRIKIGFEQAVQKAGRRSLRGGLTPLVFATCAAVPAISQTTSFSPWIYEGGTEVLGPNLHLEDFGNTVYMLSKDLVTFSQQSGARDEALLMNFANFSPPEHYPVDQPAGGGGRQLNVASVKNVGLQLYVNYGLMPLDPGATGGPQYEDGTFFISLPNDENYQTSPPVAGTAISGVTISATRGAFGSFAFPAEPGFATPGPSQEALYITGSVGFAESDIDFGSLTALEVMGDKFFVMVNGVWQDQTNLIPIGTYRHNNSGVAFLDANSDGFMDLYVGAQGDDYKGAEDSLLVFDPSTGSYVLENNRINGPAYLGSATDVKSADVDHDGDIDIVVANRMPREGDTTPGGQDRARNFVLVNNGGGSFDRVFLEADGSGVNSRSVEVGDLDNNVNDPSSWDLTTKFPELIFANHAGDAHTSEYDPLANPFEPTKIYQLVGGLGAGLSYLDVAPTFLPLEQILFSSPFCVQIVLEDIRDAQTGGYGSDGYLDLMFVCRSETQRIKFPFSNVELPLTAQLVTIGMNGPATVGNGRVASPAGNFANTGTQTLCMGDFVGTGGLSEADRRDMLIGAGSQWNGMVCELVWIQNAGKVLDTTYDRLPGNEKGYGFDFGFANAEGNHAVGVQGSRGYQFTYQGIANPNPGTNRHWNLTEDFPLSPAELEYNRGQSTPKVGEDGVLADFDGDGDLDVLFVGGAEPSDTHPDKGTAAGRAPIGAFLYSQSSGGGSWASYRHDDRVVDMDVTNLSSLYTGSKKRPVDESISSTRHSFPYAGSGDRSLAADLDNDSDIDAIVQLFDIRRLVNPTGSDLWTYSDNTNGFSQPEGSRTPDAFTVGWMLLMNEGSSGGLGPDFVDRAGTNLRDQAGGFSPYWNRGLGDSILGDYDNNGSLDLYSGQGNWGDVVDIGPLGELIKPAVATAGAVSDAEQLRDCLFFNAIDGNTPGVFKESAAVEEIGNPRFTVVPHGGLWPDIAESAGDFPEAHDFAGTGAMTQGDIDNDGDADLVLFHQVPGQLVSRYPSMLVNRLEDTSKPGHFPTYFDEEFGTRVLAHGLDNQVIPEQTVTRHGTGVPLPDLDFASNGELFDMDGDGDLDLVYQIMREVPRVLRNMGSDTDGNGWIDANDSGMLGHFEDVTAQFLLYGKPITDATDMQVVDIDSDGDLDMVFNAWDDVPHFWKNGLAANTKPAITEAWPRIGRTGGGTVELHGVRLHRTRYVQIKGSDGSIRTLGSAFLTDVSNPGFDYDRIQVNLPNDLPLGQAQIRIYSHGKWSTQYFGYFIQG